MKGRCQINKPKIRPKTRKRPWQRNEEHRAFVRKMNCAMKGRHKYCEERPCEFAHVRKGSDGAMGRKPSDRYGVPLCVPCHRRQHQIGETRFWAKIDADPLDLAAKLWALSRKYEGGDLLYRGAYAIRQWRETAQHH